MRGVWWGLTECLPAYQAIVDEFEVPFDMPRDPEIRFTGEFAELVGKVSHALRGAHS